MIHRLIAAAASLGLVGVFAGLALIVATMAAGSDPSRLTLAQRLGFSVMVSGLGWWLTGMCVLATARAPGLVGKVVVFLLLWLPLGLPAIVGTIAGLGALWFFVP